MRRGGLWIKVAFLLIGVVVLVGIANVLMDSGLGTPDDAHRTRHPAGFSVSTPLGWGASCYPVNDDGEEILRMSPERVSGRSTIIAVVKLQKPPTISDAAVRGTFQGQPADVTQTKTRYLHYWTMHFQRDGKPFSIVVSNPIELDVFNSPYMPFLNSFKVEPVIETAGEKKSPLASPATTP